MASSSLWDYIFIRTSIFFLNLIAPLSILYLLASTLFRLPSFIPRVIEIWLTIEAAFFILVYIPLHLYLQRPATHPATLSPEDRRTLFRRCHINVPDPERHLRKWFRDAPADEIKRENVKDFFRWAFLNAAESDSTYDQELDEYINEMEMMLGRTLEPGRGNAQCMRLTLDKVEMLHRSLTWYLCIVVVDIIASGYLRCYSFDFYRGSCFDVFPPRPLGLFGSHRSPAKKLTYWYRPHTSSTRLPILFIHGIGVGLYPYIDFLHELNAGDRQNNADGQLGIIAVEIMSVSSRITGQAMSRETISEEIRCIVKSHGWEKFVLVSHSYGSVVAAHLLHTPTIASKIGPMLFIDPVAFLLHHPDVAYNFICRKPATANEHVLSYFGSKDIGVAHTLFRRFFWANNILWKEDIRHHRVAVSLGGNDLVVNTKVIKAYLTGGDDWYLKTEDGKNGETRSGNLDVLWFPELHHAEVFDQKSTRGPLVETVRRFCMDG